VTVEWLGCVACKKQAADKCSNYYLRLLFLFPNADDPRRLVKINAANIFARLFLNSMVPESCMQLIVNWIGPYMAMEGR
jgi:hypothetical protein